VDKSDMEHSDAKILSKAEDIVKKLNRLQDEAVEFYPKLQDLTKRLREN